jgi:hypothetical protein
MPSFCHDFAVIFRTLFARVRKCVEFAMNCPVCNEFAMKQKTPAVAGEHPGLRAVFFTFLVPSAL